MNALNKHLCPKLKKYFQIPLTHFPPLPPILKNAPNCKKIPQIKKAFSNSTYTFAPIAPNLKKMPPIKKTFSNSTNTFAPIAPNLKKMSPIF